MASHATPAPPSPKSHQRERTLHWMGRSEDAARSLKQEVPRSRQMPRIGRDDADHEPPARALRPWRAAHRRAAEGVGADEAAEIPDIDDPEEAPRKAAP